MSPCASPWFAGRPMQPPRAYWRGRGRQRTTVASRDGGVRQLSAPRGSVRERAVEEADRAALVLGGMEPEAGGVAGAGALPQLDGVAARTAVNAVGGDLL